MSTRQYARLVSDWSRKSPPGRREVLLDYEAGRFGGFKGREGGLGLAIHLKEESRVFGKRTDDRLRITHKYSRR
jgi:hypothetical protein